MKHKQSRVEATHWWVAMRSGDSSRSEREQFVDWLQASPENVAEYLELADLWGKLGSIRTDADIEQLIAEAHESSNVVEFAPESRAPPPVNKRPWKLYGAVAAVASMFVVAIGALMSWPEQSGLITTAVGELRSMSLADGSIITLNTRTSLRYAFDDSLRQVELIDGEALFDVAHDLSRPFIVSAGEHEIRALGTSFNVYKKSDIEATVTVLEGRVVVRASALIVDERVASASDHGQPGEPALVELTSGEQIHIQPKELRLPVTPVSPDRAAEWTTRRITFENSALRDVVAQFNRYSVSQLLVDDPELADMRLNGVFEPHSQEDLLAYLRQVEGVNVRGVGNDWVISR
ncbi:MAG: FecR family protein [Gammaproteobacteria bacterium]|nr:FecR family protein [Gammaproteobacteria bacterium]